MITPEQLASSGSEDGHQLALFCWIAINQDKYPELMRVFAIPNGGSRHEAEAVKLKAMGIKNGVSDICFPLPRGRCHGLFIELKRLASKGKSKGVVSAEQTDWIDYFRSVGYGAMVCYGWEHARDILIQYLESKCD